MKNQKQPSLLIDRVKSATSSVELIGYLEDSKNSSVIEQAEIVAMIQVKMSEFSMFKPRIVLKEKRIRGIGQLFDSRAGTARVEQTDPDFYPNPTGGNIIDDLLKPKNARPQSGKSATP